MNEDLPKLLRAIAGGTSAKEAGHDIILSAAAIEIEALRAKVDYLVSALRDARDVVNR